MVDNVKSLMFTYEGKNQQGNTVKGELTSVSLLMAKAELRKQGIVPIKVKKKTKSIFSGGGQGRAIRAADIAVFSRQLSTMISAGIPIVQSLDILGRGAENVRFSSLIMSIKGDVESGTALSKAFHKHGNYFNDLFCNLIDAGEQSGQLDTMLDRIATYREKTEELKAKVKKALFYPSAVLVIAFLITSGLLIFVVPQFEKIFANFGADLPVATKFILSLSQGFTKYWYIIFGAITISTIAFIQARRRSQRFVDALQRWSLKLPIIGIILRKSAIARFARTLSITFAAGLPLVEALNTVAGATGNIIYADATRKVRDDVQVGLQMHHAMTTTGEFPIMVTQMISIGEEAGSLEFMLSKVADFYESEVDTAVSNLSSLLEPVIMVILGIIIGGLVVAMYMPIFKLGGVI